jgi:hypothetical protein
MQLEGVGEDRRLRVSAASPASQIVQIPEQNIHADDLLAGAKGRQTMPKIKLAVAANAGASVVWQPGRCITRLDEGENG